MGLRKWWDRYRHFRAAQGLAQDILNWFGWKKSVIAFVAKVLLALGAGIVTWIKAANMRPVEVWVLVLVTFAAVLVILNLIPPVIARLCSGFWRKPSEPIATLTFSEWHPGDTSSFPLRWADGRPTWIAVKNIQAAPAMTAHNVTARMEFTDSKGNVRHVVRQACWFEIQHPTPTMKIEGWRKALEIEGSDEQSFVMFVQLDDRKVMVCRDAGDPVGFLDFDHWLVKIIVTADDAVGFEGTVGFTFTKHTMPPDVPAFTLIRSIPPLLKQP